MTTLTWQTENWRMFRQIWVRMRSVV